jgi:hypothetical protein
VVLLGVLCAEEGKYRFLFSKPASQQSCGQTYQHKKLDKMPQKENLSNYEK